MKRSRSYGTLTLAWLITASLAGAAWADNWPNWRGPDNNGISKETKLPVKWSTTENIAWKLPMPGVGGSTPIIWDDRIFVTSGEGGNLVLLCINTQGKTLWKRKLGVSEKQKIKGDEGNEASCTPSTDGKHIWTFVGSGDFACHDFDGNEIWKFNAQKRYGKFDMYHGVHTSPLLYGDRLYLSLQQGTTPQNGYHWVIALDKATGEEVWKVDRPTDAKVESRQAYTTPLMWENDKENCLVIVACDYATGHRLSDGKEIWRLSGLNPGKKTDHRFVSSPVATRDLLVVPTNRDKGPIFAVKPGASGAIAPSSPFVQWQAKGAPDVPSPLIHNGLIYLCTAEVAFLTCLDAKTGKQMYSERLESGRYRACPVYADGNIYVTGREGNVTVVKAGPKFERLAVNVLPDFFTASPAISKSRIYLRGFKNLYAIEAGAPALPSP